MAVTELKYPLRAALAAIAGIATISSGTTARAQRPDPDSLERQGEIAYAQCISLHDAAADREAEGKPLSGVAVLQENPIQISVEGGAYTAAAREGSIAREAVGPVLRISADGHAFQDYRDIISGFSALLSATFMGFGATSRQEYQLGIGVGRRKLIFQDRTDRIIPRELPLEQSCAPMRADLQLYLAPRVTLFRDPELGARWRWSFPVAVHIQRVFADWGWSLSVAPLLFQFSPALLTGMYLEGSWLAPNLHLQITARLDGYWGDSFSGLVLVGGRLEISK